MNENSVHGTYSVGIVSLFDYLVRRTILVGDLKERGQCILKKYDERA